MLPEQLAGKRADQAMVLMRVAAPMSEDQRRIEPAPHPGETILYRRALEGEIRIAKIEGLDIVLARIGEERLGGTPHLRAANVIAAEDDPLHLRPGHFRQQPQQRAATADFYVVGMGAQAEKPQGPAPFR